MEVQNRSNGPKITQKEMYINSIWNDQRGKIEILIKSDRKFFITSRFEEVFQRKVVYYSSIGNSKINLK